MSRPSRPPAWKRPPGVTPGVWDYLHQRTIASRYDEFVADTPLCSLDQAFVLAHLRDCDQTAQTARPIVVDLGCGTGRVAIPLAESGIDVVAVDLSRGMLEQLMDKLDGSAAHPASLFPLQANLVQLGCLADRRFDHAVCLFSTLGMIQGRKHRVQFLSHVHRILQPSGTFVLHVHRRWAALRESGGIGQLLRSALGSFRDDEHEFGDREYGYRGLDRMFMHRFSARSIRNELRLAGFRQVQLQCVSIDGSEFSRSMWNTGGWMIVCRK